MVVRSTFRFIASPPGTQDKATYRQFQELQTYLQNIERRLAPVYDNGTIDPLVLTDAWQPLVVTGFDKEEQVDATYSVQMLLSVSGSNANAEVQVRISSDYASVTGEIITIGNQSLELFTLPFVTTLGPSGLAFEMRGTSSELLSSRILIFKIGISP